MELRCVLQQKELPGSIDICPGVAREFTFCVIYYNMIQRSVVGIDPEISDGETA